MSHKLHCIQPHCTLGKVYAFGYYIRKSDSKRIKRFRCSFCKLTFSKATFDPCFAQKKRFLNDDVLMLLCSSVSQRRIALLLKINLKTVARKFIFLSKLCAKKNQNFLELYKKEKLSEVFMDEMEDKIHTKCKPVGIAVMVNPDRKILGCQVSPMRPKNKKLYEISLQKYPEWNNQCREGVKQLLEKVASLFQPEIIIHSDEKLMYLQEIRKKFPQSLHKRYKSRRAVIAGQGELKEGGYDPLFPLNHTCAMIRANINRLVRKTWCTSKKIQALSAHIEIYTYFHNFILT